MMVNQTLGSFVMSIALGIGGYHTLSNSTVCVVFY